MIAMAVGEEDGLRFELPLFNMLEHGLRIKAAVENPAFVGCLGFLIRGHDKTVGLKGAKCEGCEDWSRHNVLFGAGWWI